MIGVEGYVEFAVLGFVVGINVVKFVFGQDFVIFLQEMVIGSMVYYIMMINQKNFQLMNVNFGLLKELFVKIKNKKE